jgi:Ca2+/Na+ antiporter
MLDWLKATVIGALLAVLCIVGLLLLPFIIATLYVIAMVVILIVMAWFVIQLLKEPTEQEQE